MEYAIGRGINYLNWCGHPDGLSQAVAGLGKDRGKVVVAAQFQARTARTAARELDRLLNALRTDYLDILTFYYVESEQEWEELLSPKGSYDYVRGQKEQGRVRLLGLTSHQRKLAARWAQTGRLDMLMIRYNAAHRGAEKDVFPVTSSLGMPVVTFTGLRWGALLKSTPEDPPGFQPPKPADCYRFCLVNPAVTVALTAPGNRAKLDHDLALLDDWRPPPREDLESMRAHGDRVHRHASEFW